MLLLLIVAFSWFAFFEYLIAIANMLFHFMVVWDFPTQHMLVLQATHKQVYELIQQTPQKQQHQRFSTPHSEHQLSPKKKEN